MSVCTQYSELKSTRNPHRDQNKGKVIDVKIIDHAYQLFDHHDVLFLFISGDKYVNPLILELMFERLSPMTVTYSIWSQSCSSIVLPNWLKQWNKY